ncbi:Endolytic peptidoglycan transglycosylase RlpA [Zhongshania aliphaticivorans]|uniref:Endolytic peptidoglycan transglycosylase RlpA n=1 Tax=Zhongshania aliphaticivorans TaxID=1470434 RepID=A0A5S9NV25_9GAMM|nr:septal ring lytic transglycosylase RlpA family protein [Zhongshania aliphaticivorans]CAA0094578.1 Endolytic peptidoglycan transglycosylase RlpA [Zhongshania aliphaticivorans]CAA0112573.1 Endolytic peptidoglycan transglycosylase RlpA [Zhongshania aliphaticivorans]
MNHRFLAIVAVLVMAGCASAPPVEKKGDGIGSAPRETSGGTGGSRYQFDKDGAPLQKLDPNTIADAEPRYEVLRVSGNISPYVVNGKEYRLVEQHRGFKQRGIASWYGTKFHGHATSNGEIYSLYEMTAAHRTLPIPVYVKVTNLDNGKTAVVRVNDRGPFHSDRIIDLSYAAAVKLDYVNQGTARVEIEVIDTDNTQLAPNAAAARYYLQVAAFSQLNSANVLQQKLSADLAYPVMIATSEGRGTTLHRVRIGPFIDYSSAQAAKKVLKQQWTGEPHLVVDAGDS